MPQDVNKRNVVDTNRQTTAAVAAAGAAANHSGIDTGGSGPHREGMEVHVDVPAMASLVDDKTVIFTLDDSADNSTFAAGNNGQSFTVTGAGGSGAAATSFRFKIPSDAARYVRVTQTTLAAAGDNTGVTITASLLT